MIVIKPIYSIGRFYTKLSPAGQKKAKAIARIADRTPKHVLDSVYWELKHDADTYVDYSNFKPVDQL